MLHVTQGSQNVATTVEADTQDSYKLISQNLL